MIKRLIEEVEKKYGEKISTANDCKYLSQEINDSINELISDSTLRRFFGLLSASSKPSAVTLSILSRFVGFEDWKDFQLNRNIENLKSESETIWQKSFEIAKRISLENIKKSKIKIGLEFDRITQRDFAIKKIDDLIRGNHTATAFIAPGGSGKSIILSKWTDSQLSSEIQRDIILLLKAQYIISKINKETKLESWIANLLGVNSLNVLAEIADDISTNSKLVIIIDGLDDISNIKQKFDSFFSDIIQLINQYKSTNYIKIIISSRNTTWENCASIITNSGKAISDAWFDVELRYNINNKTNIPPLSRREIQRVFDITINNQKETKLVFDELSLDLRNTISHPYFLNLFINIYDPNLIGNLTSSADLLDEFLKTQIYYSNNSDEKIDILYAIIDSCNAGINGYRMKKKELSNQYPIKLKNAGNYFDAYHDMLSFGIITEEITENQYGLLTKYVFITHQNLFETLIINQLIEFNEGVNFELFNDIELYYNNKDIQPLLISLLYQKAYKNRNHEVLSQFFSLSDNTIDNSHVIETIGNCLRSDKLMQEKLIPVYAKNSKARKFYFERFIDTNYLIASYKFQMEQYYKNSTLTEEKIFSLSFLLQAEIVSLELNKYKELYNELKKLKPEEGMSPIVISRWTACMIAMDYIANIKETNLFDKITFYKELTKLSLADKKQYKEHDFEYYVFPVLLLSGKSDEFNKFMQKHHSENSKNFLTNSLSPKNNHSAIFAIYFQTLKTDKIEDKQVNNLINILDNLSPTEGYLGIMTIQTLLCKYYLRNDDTINAIKYFTEGLKIASSSRFHLYELLLLDIFLKEIAKTNSKINISEYKKRHHLLHSKINFLKLNY